MKVENGTTTMAVIGGKFLYSLRRFPLLGLKQNTR
jgi:hypothetical protein